MMSKTAEVSTGANSDIIYKIVIKCHFQLDGGVKKIWVGGL